MRYQTIPAVCHVLVPRQQPVRLDVLTDDIIFILFFSVVRNDKNVFTITTPKCFTFVRSLLFFNLILCRFGCLRLQRDYAFWCYLCEFKEIESRN